MNNQYAVKGAIFSLVHLTLYSTALKVGPVLDWLRSNSLIWRKRVVCIVAAALSCNKWKQVYSYEQVHEDFCPR